MNYVLAALITLVMGLFAFVPFILTYFKEEIWETIVFGGDTIE